jgi:hypothetical protein
MKRNWLFVFAALLFLTVLAAPVSAWQGRMAGVGDAYGLIEDESDYLTHPAVIAMGKGFNAYGHYRLTYDKTSKWDYSVREPGTVYIYPYEAKGDEWKHEGQVGAAFQLGAGRLGIFFDYVGIKGRYDGSESYYEHEGDEADYLSFDLKNDLKSYALRFIYGVPIGAVKLGTEVQIAYRDEEKRVIRIIDGGASINPFTAANDYPQYNFFPYMIPFKSRYWEAQGKVSAAGQMGPAKYAVTLKGGVPFATDNNYVRTEYEFDGKVKGFNVGGDFWLRVPVSATVVLPFVVSAGYKKMKRNGSYEDEGAVYEHEAENIFAQLGGGVDVTPAKGTRLAAGIYYTYLQTKQNAYFDEYNYPDMPEYSEHRLTLKMLAEKELTPAFALRGGFSAFYGFVKSDYAYQDFSEEGEFNTSADGFVWGLNVSLGATVKLNAVVLEPFLNGGYAWYKTDGDGILVGPYVGGPYYIETEFKKNDWHVGGGLSVRF